MKDIKITPKEAKLLIEVLGEGMPEGKIKRKWLAQLYNRLEDLLLHKAKLK